MFSARGATVLTASDGNDHTAKLWSTESGECLMTLEGYEEEFSQPCSQRREPRF